MIKNDKKQVFVVKLFGNVNKNTYFSDINQGRAMF